ncbi:translation elongation factor 2/ribosome biogenesis protein RIA1 [Suhomyces tanzawaensis NRRL Y-17324]|uniref:Ribosome assembly protein 1 n=1 Tax=Suhomyces tanzawaensis NRRL Y-17324 TaxID=984487 RepID=A0A1E4SDF9_9ASCO|nr:translation elongation factor 2/ribosome biogenesis protein RIA1 [Suhomyces tanzawaensis NRRL Y-17324]ODV77550.1 translation elongation factor 2/ribosome biogenesis protein RIA1 [Suhomyces tanzawaensis NRRL Y-17324]
MKLSQETVHQLQSNPECIRNICILAHVDHGKTSLSDSLLATNGIISQRMAGKVRYLDSREDEQLRGITMEASAISLYFKVVRRKQDSEHLETNEHLINLIDSPGHIDFSSEVSTSSRLCDGAVVLVDVVEGVCSQTVNVLRQCWVDKLKPLLVLNKIDRLITEWQLTPMEAYQHLSKVIEQVNSVIGSFFAGERMEDDMIWRESGATTEFVEKDDQDIYFTPEKNNVIFASAVDGWAFSVHTFAKIYLAKLGFSQSVLSKTLWGDFYLDMKNKKIIPKKKLKATQNLKPLFVGLILEQVWAVYENCVIERNQEKLEKIIEKLGAKVSPRDLRSKDYKNTLNVIMSQWIPISHALLGAVIDFLPSPVDAQKERIGKILDESMYSAVSESNKAKIIDPEFEKAILTCDSSNPQQHTIAYVSKLISVKEEDLPKESTSAILTADELRERGRIARELAKKASESIAEKSTDEFTVVKADPFEWEFEEDEFEEEEEEEEITPETLIAFTRIYAGSLSKGQKITVIGPKYDPSLPNDSESNAEQITHEVEIKDLYLIMGREFVKMDNVPAGNIVGVVGLELAVLKNATLCSDLGNKPYINFSSTSTLIHNKPIMKIAVEPTNPMKLSRLERGLDLLAKADPIFEWHIDDDSGELIVCVAGELHLERCLKDLEERFAKGCEVTVKEPVIPFREGLSEDPKEVGEADDDVVLPGVDLQFEVTSLPKEVTQFLIDNEAEIYEIGQTKSYEGSFKAKLIEIISENPIKSSFKSAEELVNSIITFGPKRVGPNIFAEFGNSQFRHLLDNKEGERFEFESSVLNGFQIATNEGPLASEPLQGILVTLKKSKYEIVDEESRVVNLSGRIITLTRDLIHKTFLLGSPRLFLAMYTCDIQASSEVLGKVYAVVQRRGGSIISEEMKEGTPFFTIEAQIPVIEAFGFSEEIRKKTSGAASPQLVFAGFDMLDIDPFWVPHTEEELEELGEFAERENVARRYMNTIRRRKGLFVDEKVVKNAEKQRTLKKD